MGAFDPGAGRQVRRLGRRAESVATSYMGGVQDEGAPGADGLGLPTVHDVGSQQADAGVVLVVGVDVASQLDCVVAFNGSGLQRIEGGQGQWVEGGVLSAPQRWLRRGSLIRNRKPLNAPFTIWLTCWGTVRERDRPDSVGQAVTRTKGHAAWMGGQQPHRRGNA